MRHRYRTLLLFCAAVAFVVTGCDQSAQKADPENANRYIISQNNSTSGDAATGSFAGANAVSMPDTVDYYVQGYTTNKDYTWSVNDSDLPTATSSDQTYRWESRGGEFITVVFAPGDPIATLGTNSITVDADNDNIDAETIEVSAAVRDSVSGQIARFGTFSTLSGFASSSGVDEILSQETTAYTLFAPSDAAFAAEDDPVGALGAAPTQAVDPDEAPTSSVRADFVKYHTIVGDSLTSDDLPANNVETLLGNTTIEEVTADMVKQADIPATNGVIHKLNTFLLPPTASVDFTDRGRDSTLTAGQPVTDTVTVDGSFIPEGGGFIVLHDSTELANQGAIPSVVGSSGYISPNTVANEVKVPLDESIQSTTTLGAMPHEDTNDNEAYDFETSAGTQDGPYTLEGDPIIDYGIVTISE